MTSTISLPTQMTLSLEDDEGDLLFEHVAGALFGGAIADAMGWVTEFARSVDDVKRVFGAERISDFTTWEKKSGGRFHTYLDYIQGGDYSDDTQLTLCTARSIRADGSFDARYFAKTELPRWLDYARGAGATITAAARAASRKRADWNSNFFTFSRGKRRYDYREAGANGAAMRIAPLALANVKDSASLPAEVAKNAVTTHGHPRAILGALVYAKALQFLVSERNPSLPRFLAVLRDFIDQGANEVFCDPALEVWLERWNTDTTLPSFQLVWSKTQAEMRDMLETAAACRTKDMTTKQILGALGCFDPETKGSGTATVVAAIALFLAHGKNFKATVLDAVNQIGSDTDTIGAMAASLSGAYLGYTAIPEKWALGMQDFDYFLRVSEALTRIASRDASRNDLQLDTAEESRSKGHDLHTAMQERDITSGMRVWDPLFGLGWVMAADTKPIGVRQGGSMLLARVSFDIGQSCVFRSASYSPLKTLQR